MNLFYSPTMANNRRGVKTIALKVCMAVVFSFLFINSSTAQLVPQLVFQTPSLESGAAGADGAVYRFSNVTTGIDVLVTIVDRSNANVSLTDIDVTSSGSGNAFQPRINYTGSNANSDWYMDFSIHFVAAGTTNELPAGSGIIYKATAFDIDGDDNRIREYVQAFAHSSYQVDPATELTVSPVTVTYGPASYPGTEFLGPLTDYTDIDVNAPLVATTLSYANQNIIGFRLGARNATGVSGSSSNRYSSILFNNFLYIAPGPLPVNLLSFTAKLNKNNTVLDWTTANEVNFSHFTIQRSTDGKSFTDIGTVAGKQSGGNANTLYTFTDNSAVQSTIVYYRLKMVDQDATFKYSEIRLIRKSNDQNQASVLVYPNPVVSELRVTIPDSWQSKAVSYTIYNSNGNAIAQRTINSAGQTEMFNLSGAAAGLYTVRVIKDTETIVKQFIKN